MNAVDQGQDGSMDLNGLESSHGLALDKVDDDVALESSPGDPGRPYRTLATLLPMKLSSMISRIGLTSALVIVRREV